METPTLRQFRTFVVAVERGSITEAARALNLTQPAASQQLREMERIVGIKLLERAGGTVIPTAAGQAVLGQAQQACTAAAAAVAAAKAYRAGEVGRVRIGTGATACIYLLPPVLAAARRQMPGLEIIVAIGNSPEILRRVEDGCLDDGLVALPRHLGRALSRQLVCRDELVALLPAGTPGGQALSTAELSAMPLILYEQGADTRSLIDAWFRASGLSPKPIMERGSVEAIKVLVGSGLGASVLPRMALRDTQAGTLIRPLRRLPSHQIGLVIRKEKVLDGGLRVLKQALLRQK